jgi:uncharacterized protein (UPF0276 family)
MATPAPEPTVLEDRTGLPREPGLGLKHRHVEEILASRPAVGFFEIHAENYMGAGGPPHRALSAISARWPISVHGVGLSIGGESPLDEAHLQRLRTLCERWPPASFSEHLAWSSHDGRYLNDLLPVAYDQRTLDRVCRHVDRVQTVLGRRMLLENPSTYLAFASNAMHEIDFLARVAERTGCGLLLDVNNVYVSAVNQGTDPADYLDGFPVEHVGEVHLGGAAADIDDSGAPLLIDAHDRPVLDPVWQLFERLVARTGPLPTLIEWDNDVPDLAVLLAEADRARSILRRSAERRA